MFFILPSIVTSLEFYLKMIKRKEKDFVIRADEHLVVFASFPFDSPRKANRGWCPLMEHCRI
jgi:hypothetical protein